MEYEFGSESGVRFLEPENVHMYDEVGEVARCKCGNPATCAAIGLDACVAWCSKCSPLCKESEEFIYSPINI